jgi:ERF superfamily
MTDSQDIRRKPSRKGGAHVTRSRSSRTRRVASENKSESGSAALEALIDMVGRPDADLARIEHLTGLYERLVAREAEISFAAALTAMQRKLPVIDENGAILGPDGERVASYATWEDTVEAIRPILARHGFALSFRPGRSHAGFPTVTGVLRHVSGHREEGVLELPPDTSGGKNALQAIGSSTSCGQRYVARMLLSLTSRGGDDDAREATLSPEAASAIADIDASQGPTALIDWKRRNRASLATLSPSDFRHVVSRYASHLRQLTSSQAAQEAA